MKISNDKLIIKFEQYLHLEVNYSEYTVNNYLHVINKLSEYSKGEKQTLLELTNDDLKIFLTDYYDLGYAKTSIANVISIIKAFYRFCNLKKYLDNNPALNLVYPKREQKLPEFFFHQQIIDLFQTINQESKKGSRDYLIILLFYSTGIRLSELLQIKLDNINVKKHELRVMGKGQKERIVIINNYVIDALKNFLFYWEIDDYIFLNMQNKQLTPQGVRYILNGLVKENATIQKISPHMLRHSFATELLNSGMDIRLVQELLGHESIASTQVYTHVSKNQLRDKYLKIDLRK